MSEPASNAKSFPAGLSPRSRVLFSLLCGLVALYFARSAGSIAAAAASGLLSVFNAAGLGRFLGNLVDLGDLLSTLCLLFLLLLGYWVMARWLNSQRRPLVSMGLQPRPGWLREWGIGAALGWGLIVAALLPMAIVGALHYSFAFTYGTLWLFFVNVLYLLLATLTEEVIYRGYAFQRFVDGIGPAPAVIVMASLYTAIHWHDEYYFSPAHVLVLFLGSVLLSLAYLRTRALWLVWGLHFAWSFSEGDIFGLPVAGSTRFSTLLQADTLGPVWLTGGNFGPEDSQVMVLALLAAIMVLVIVTRDYNWKYNPPVILPGGMPVEVAPPAAHAAAEAAAATPKLVQIVPTAPAPTAPPTNVDEHD